MELGDKQRLHTVKLQKLYKTNRKLYWAKRYHRNTKGERMYFKNALFLVPIYNALNSKQRVCVIKSVQCGLSEATIISHLEEASRGLSILYVLPKTESRNTFVQNRINKVIQRVPYYRNLMQQANTKSRVDSVILKNFGKGTIKYVDSNSESNFVEYPCDAVYLDEKDLMNQKNIEKAQDRIERSKYKLQRHLANPSVEDFGIHADWTESTQEIYHTKCPHCGEWQPYDWFVNVVREIGERQYEAVDTEWAKGDVKEARVFCRKCWKPIYRFAPGEYVAKYRNREWYGFHVNKVFGSPYRTLASIVRKFFRALRNDTKLQIFFNSDLGLPYASSHSKIGETELNACNLSNYYEPKENTTGFAFAGVDVGNFYHIIIRKLAVVNGEERKILLFCGKVRKKEELIKKFKQYGVKSAVIDALPETRAVETLQGELSYLYKCFWSATGKDPKLDKNNKTVTFDRTSAIDAVKEQVDYKVYANYTNMDSHPEYYTHMKSNTRVYDAEANRFVWVQSNKDDHLGMTEAYCELACKLKLASNVFEFYENIHDEYKDARQTTKGKTHSQVVGSILDRFYGKNRKK